MGEAWSVEFPPNESEWPDLLIRSGACHFGLEVREITKDTETRKGSKRKANESSNLRKIQILAENYYEISSIPLKVGIIGEIEDSSQLKDVLVKFARGSKDWDREEIAFGANTEIYVTRLPAEAGRYIRWESVRDKVGWVREVDIEFVRPFVSEKEARITKYMTHVQDVRLLLVADSSYGSGMLEFREDGLKIRSRFSEIYLFEYPNKVHLIRG